MEIDFDEYRDLQNRIAELETRIDRVCYWTESVTEWGPNWEGSCGAEWEFIEGGPAENDMRYCPKCGGKVSSRPWVEPECAEPLKDA